MERLGRTAILDDYTIETCEVPRSCTKATSTSVATDDEERAADAPAAGHPSRTCDVDP